MKDGQLLLLFIFGLIGWLIYKYRTAKKKLDETAKIINKLQAENEHLKLDQLKFQVEPHTLKNIMANLNVIAKKLHKGLDSLSNVAEYILYQGKKHFVSIEQEVEFIEQYLKLNDLFISEIDSVKFNNHIDKNSPFYNKQCIPHLVTAYFLENAYKHGNTSHPDFLSIDLALKGNQLIYSIKNKISKRPENPKGKGGLGLENMKKRLDIFYKNKYTITASTEVDNYVSTLTLELNEKI